MYKVFRPVLFKIDPELIHHVILWHFSVLGLMPGLCDKLRSKVVPRKEEGIKLFGLHFQNRVGLAAGFDKDAVAWRGLSILGFGHIEVGTVTRHPQSGNPKPRLFRLPMDQALVNRMGFPGKGINIVNKNLNGRKPKGLVLGVNIGKNKDTPLVEASEEYCYLFEKAAIKADYVAINVSSPNTLNLRRLQSREYLNGILSQIENARERIVRSGHKYIPVLVKISPDITDKDLDDILQSVFDFSIDGIIATNTTIRRDGLSSLHALEAGGLSGKPLFPLSIEIVKKIADRTNEKIPIIGVGGIDSVERAKQMIDAGASLVQIYTGMIYQGPGLILQLARI